MAFKLILRPSGILIPRDDLGVKGQLDRDLVLGDDIGLVAALGLGFDGNQSRLLRVDANGNLRVTTASAAGMNLVQQVLDGQTARQAVSIAGITDGIGGVSVPAVGEVVLNGASFDRVRTPTIWKTATANAAGVNTIWTPAAGKKFRLMRLLIQVPADVTLGVAAEQVIQIFDQGAGTGLVFRFYITAAARTVDLSTPWIELGNGILSAAANNVLQASVGTVLAAGNILVLAGGTEE